MPTIQVVATPLNPTEPDEFLIECSACGPLGSVLTHDPGPFVIDHITTHQEKNT